MSFCPPVFFRELKCLSDAVLRHLHVVTEIDKDEALPTLSLIERQCAEIFLGTFPHCETGLATLPYLYLSALRDTN
jgi:hypothetical protein